MRKNLSAAFISVLTVLAVLVLSSCKKEKDDERDIIAEIESISRKNATQTTAQDTPAEISELQTSAVTTGVSETKTVTVTVTDKILVTEITNTTDIFYSSESSKIGEPETSESHTQSSLISESGSTSTSTSTS